MANSNKFLSSFPCLVDLNIRDIKQVKEKLKFVGKINSRDIKVWCITSMSYDPYSMTELNLTIQNDSEKYKIVYREEIKEPKGKKTPIIRSRKPHFVQEFKLSIQVLENETDSKNIKHFQFKKAS